MSQNVSTDGAESCVMCDKPGAFACPICKGPMYCGKRHQNIHWTQHEDECNVVHTGSTEVAVPMPYDLIDEEGMPINTRDAIRVFWQNRFREGDMIFVWSARVKGRVNWMGSDYVELEEINDDGEYIEHQLSYSTIISPGFSRC